MNRISDPFSDRIFLIKMVFTALCGSAMVILAAAGSVSAFDSYRLIQDGHIALDLGRTSEAEALFERYIDSHPATSGEHSPKYRKRRQYYIKNLLTAYSDLLDIYRETGKEAEFTWRLSTLKATFENGDFSDKNVYNLTEIYLALGREEDAEPLLEQIVQNNVISHYPYNTKVMLRAASKLVQIYKAKGKTEAMEDLLATLVTHYPDPGFDITDKYNLALLYLGNGRETQGAGLLNEIVAEEPFDFRSPYVHTLTRTYAKLLNISREKVAPVARRKLLAQLASGGVENLSPGNSYILAVALLNAGEKKEGRRLLDILSTGYPETVWARKSLFLCAREAMSNKEWDTAIDRYTAYIARYPEQTFFILKAYSGLLDAHWARDGNLEDQNIRVGLFADILNEVADYETQLNLARDLKDKGYDELADATFELGLAGARNRLRKPLEDEERLRLHWIIQRYAHPLGKFELVEDSCRAALDLLDDPAAANLASSEKSRFIKSQTYIWLAKTYKETGRTEKAAKTFADFLTEFPEGSDANFVRYSLAEIYEESGDFPRAEGLYEKIDSGVWKERASRNLTKQGQRP